MSQPIWVVSDPSYGIGLHGHNGEQHAQPFENVGYLHLHDQNIFSLNQTMNEAHILGEHFLTYNNDNIISKIQRGQPNKRWF